MGLATLLFGGDEGEDNDRDEYDFLGNLGSLGPSPQDLAPWMNQNGYIDIGNGDWVYIGGNGDPTVINSGDDDAKVPHGGINYPSGQSPGVLANLNQFLQQTGLTRKDLTWGDIARGGLSLYAGIQSKNAAEEENERRRKLGDEEKARRDRLEAENAAARERYNKGMYNPNIASLGTQATRLR